MRLLQLRKGIVQYYRDHVKGNKDTPYEIIQRKLTRNVALAFHMPQDEIHKKLNLHLYLYGNLKILVRGKKIIGIKNLRYKNDWFYLDQQKYDELNKLLGIDIYEQKLEKVV
jgi:hypothetical protein